MRPSFTACRRAEAVPQGARNWGELCVEFQPWESGSKQHRPMSGLHVDGNQSHQERTSTRRPGEVTNEVAHLARCRMGHWRDPGAVYIRLAADPDRIAPDLRCIRQSISAWRPRDPVDDDAVPARRAGWGNQTVTVFSIASHDPDPPASAEVRDIRNLFAVRCWCESTVDGGGAAFLRHHGCVTSIYSEDLRSGSDQVRRGPHVHDQQPGGGGIDGAAGRRREQSHEGGQSCRCDPTCPCSKHDSPTAYPASVMVMMNHLSLHAVSPQASAGCLLYPIHSHIGFSA
jgi:hypothetical protein